ncbi:MAG: c-type cytochrome [Planctomycetes bacterium]|nr:c-type cytochrome [Planctomycetota bacterium]
MDIVRLMVLLAFSGTVAAQPVVPKDTLPERFWEAGWPFGLGDPPPSWGGPLHVDRITLGRALFFDPLLSIDRTVACASCHQPQAGFASPQALPPGAAGKRALRNAPSLYNRSLGALHSWDGKASSLQEQVVLPISNPNEMDLPLADALGRLRADAEYVKRFTSAYGSGPTEDRLADALSAFVFRLTLADSPVDRFQAAHDRAALTVEERKGLWIYESKGRCWACHSGPNFTDEEFHNSGIGIVDNKPEPGRMAVTGDVADRGRFRTPTLRGLVQSAPYMHNGSLKSLQEVVAFYRRGANKNPSLDPRLKPLDLTDEDARNLVAFLRALSRRSRD